MNKKELVKTEFDKEGLRGKRFSIYAEDLQSYRALNGEEKTMEDLVNTLISEIYEGSEV